MNIEVAPKAYWVETTVDNIPLYLFSLNIDGKTDWRLPTREEFNQSPEIPYFAPHQTGFNHMRESGLYNNLSLRIVPVRDLKDD